MAAMQQHETIRDGKQPRERRIGFDCAFVESPPDILQIECPVCLLIIREPHQVTCCGKRYCHSCIECIKADKKPCPTCKSDKYDDFFDKGMKQSLYALKIRCSHKEDGCEWTGELGQLEAHLNKDPQSEKKLDGCPFAEIDCLYECGDQLQRQKIKTHQTEHCIKRPFSCEHCHDYDTNYADVIHKHWPVCGSFPVHCPNKCGLELPRQKVGDHVDNDCPLTIINCDFHHVGCTVTLPRIDLKEHLKKNLLAHNSLHISSYTKQKAILAEQQATLAEQKLKILEQQEKIDTLSDDKNEMKSKIVNLQQNLTSLESALEKHRQTAILSLLTMNNFQELKQKDQPWYSPPFYIHHRGYKVCLKVYANGYFEGAGHNTHVAAYIYFMRGEFDDQLAWPFGGKISICLLDQLEGDHTTETIDYSDEADREFYGGRILNQEKERAKDGKGLHHFIPHSDIEKYLRNDTLSFQVIRIS